MDFAIQHENDTAIIKVNAQKLNAANAPDLKSELVLLNKNNEIVWQHKGYVDGDEYKLLKEIKKLQNK